MDRAQTVIKRNELYSLIKTVGMAWGEDLDFLRTYAVEQAQTWADNLDAAIACFRGLKEDCIRTGMIKDPAKPVQKPLAARYTGAKHSQYANRE